MIVELGGCMKKFFEELEDNICAIIVLAMTLLTCANVFARYVVLASMPFVEELTCLGLVIVSLTGAAVAAKRGAHLGLTVLTDLMPPKAQIVFTMIGHLLGVIFGFLLLYLGYFMAQNEYDLGQLTAGMQWPEWLFGMFVPISGAVLVIRYMQLFLRTLMQIVRG